jgi:predicted nucleotidyltransferase
MKPLPQFDAIAAVLDRHPEIDVAIAFGSLASGRQRPDSDLDLDLAVRGPAVLGAAAKLALIAELAAATGRAVDLVDLRQVGEPLLGQVLRHGRRLRGSDEAFAALLHRHLLDAADFMPYVQRMLAERRARWIGT